MTDTPGNQATEQTNTSTHKSRLDQLFSRLNLTQLILVVLVAVFIWQWLDDKQQMNQIQNTLSQRLAAVDGSSKANQNMTLQSQDLLLELGTKLNALETKYAETQSQRTALETLYNDLSSSRDQMVLAEVEQLLLIAWQQVQLSANIKAALIAMQQADNRLQRLDRSALNKLRQAIRYDIDKLRAVPEVDVTAINSRLNNLISISSRLPLLQDAHVAVDKPTPAAAAPDAEWQQIWLDFWREAKDLVRIQNTQQNELPLISPTQTFFLRENLKLRLLSARLALLSHDETSFKQDIHTAQEWIKLYFDVNSRDGDVAISTLQKLTASSVKIELPDIGNSLEAVRQYRASHEKGAR